MYIQLYSSFDDSNEQKQTDKQVTEPNLQRQLLRYRLNCSVHVWYEPETAPCTIIMPLSMNYTFAASSFLFSGGLLKSATHVRARASSRAHAQEKKLN